MSDDRYRDLFRSGLAPYVESASDGPGWDELTSGVVPIGRSQPAGPPGWLVGLGVAAVVLIVFGLAITRSTSTSAPVATGGDELVEFDGAAAAQAVETWWLLVITGDIQGAVAMSHPEAVRFNFGGLDDLVSILGDNVIPAATPKPGDLPVVCYTLSGSEGQSAGEVVFAEHESEWLIQEIRSPSGECAASTSTETTPATSRVTRDDCPVTEAEAVGFEPATDVPDGPPPSYQAVWHGTPQLWTMIGRQGEVWSGLPVAADGSLTQKTFWWVHDLTDISAPTPDVAVTLEPWGNELAVSVPGEDVTTGGRPDIGQFVIVGLQIPSEGCWEVTANYDGASLSYVVWVGGYVNPPMEVRRRCVTNPTRSSTPTFGSSIIS